MNRRGFTLIELLVVIAIIAILAAILFPVFAQAREKARQTACLSNTKQMALASLQYSQDFDEMLVPIYINNTNNTRSALNPHWMDLLYPFVKSEAVYTCPSRTGENSYGGVAVNPAGWYNYHTLSNGPSTFRTGAGSRYFGTYSMNGAYHAGYPYMPGGPTSIIVHPATTILFTEGGPPTGNNTDANNNFDWQFSFLGSVNMNASPFPVVAANNTIRAEAPHFGRMNISWCDGHSSSMGLAQAFAQSKAKDGTTVDTYWAFIDQ